MAIAPVVLAIKVVTSDTWLIPHLPRYSVPSYILQTLSRAGRDKVSIILAMLEDEIDHRKT